MKIYNITNIDEVEEIIEQSNEELYLEDNMFNVFNKQYATITDGYDINKSIRVNRFADEGYTINILQLTEILNSIQGEKQND